MRPHRARREWLANKVEELEQQLGEAKRDRKETRRDEEVADALAKLKRMSPGPCKSLDLNRTGQVNGLDTYQSACLGVLMNEEIDRWVESLPVPAG